MVETPLRDAFGNAPPAYRPSVVAFELRFAAWLAGLEQAVATDGRWLWFGHPGTPRNASLSGYKAGNNIIVSAEKTGVY